MAQDLSPQWERLMAKQREFMRAALEYRENVGERVQKQDLLVSLDDRIGAMTTIRLIRDGYLSIAPYPSVWYRLIGLLFDCEPSVGKWITEVLLSLPKEEKALLKEDCLRLVNYYSDKTENEIGMLLSLSLIAGLEYPEEEISEYIARHNDILQL